MTLKTADKTSILIIDDEPVSLLMLVEHLENQNVEVLVAENGESGLDQARSLKPDLILLDVILPDIDGFEICRRLKDDAQTHEIPVVFLSILEKPDHKIKAFEVGGIDYLTKPLQLDEAWARVKVHLTISRLQKQLQEKNELLQQEVNERKRAEEALKKSEQSYRSIFDNANDAIFIHEMETGTILNVNQKMLDMFGFKSKEEVVGSFGGKLSSGKTTFTEKEAVTWVREAVRGKPQLFEWHAEKKDGKLFWVEVNLKRVTIGDHDRIVALVRDIDERKKYERELIESEERYRSIFTNELDVISIFEIETRKIVDVNDSFLKLYGYSRDEALQLTVDDISAEPTISQQAVKKSAKVGHVFIPKRRHKTKDGTEITVEISAGPFTWKGRQVMYSVIRDITQRKKTEDDLKDREFWLSESQRAAQIGTYHFDILAGTWKCTDVLESIFGITGAHNKTAAGWLEIVHPEHQEELGQYLTMILTEKCDFDKEYKIIRHSDKSERWVYGRGQLIFNEHGQPINLVGTIQDITEHKLAEIALRESEERFAMVMNSMAALMYVADMETHEILFINQYTRDLFGDIEGKPCWQTLQTGQTGPCSFCSNPELVRNGEPTGGYQWEFLNTVTGRWFNMQDRAIRWIDGSLVRLEIGTDITPLKQAEQALRQREHQLRLITDNSPAYIGYVGIDLRYQFVNKKFEISFNMPREQIIGQHIRDIIGQSNYQYALKYLDIVKSGQPASYINEFSIKQGKRWIKVNYVPDFDEQHKVRGIVVLSYDITEQRSAIEQLQESERQLAETQSIAQLGSWEFDTITQQIKWSEETFRIWGREGRTDPPSIEEYLGTIHPDDVVVLEKSLEEAMQGQAYEIELRHRKPDGTYNHTLTRARPILKDGKVIKLQGSVLDITERKQVEERVRKSEERYRMLLESITDRVYLLDRDWRVLVVNENAERFTSVPKSDLLGEKLTDFFPGTRESVFFNMFQQVMQTGEPGIATDSLRDESGQTWWYEASAYPAPEGVLVIIRDVTERMLAELKLQQAKEAAEVANHAKSDFLASVSHELRTPLNAILGYTQIFQQNQSLMSDFGAQINTIHRSAEHLLHIINDILDLSKIESKKMEIIPEEFHFLDFLQTLVEMSQIQAQRKKIQFNFRGAPDLPTGVLGDETHLHQILLNLLSNAIKYTEQGQVDFTVQNIKCGPAKPDRIRFEVKDTGFGIPAERIKEIFLPFLQLSEHRFHAEGTGLGLSISQRLVHLMGSELNVESRVGLGSTFWFDLDLPAVEGITPRQFAPTHKIIGFRGRERKILIVDDYAENRDILKTMLLPPGFDIAEACDGRDALNQVKGFKPDLILLDLIMPVMDGFEFIKFLREIPEFKVLPVIAISASAFEKTQERSRAEGFDEFITKPFQREELFLCLQTHLRLEWIYEKKARIESVPAETPLIIPSQNDLENLLQLVRQRNITGIRSFNRDLKSRRPENIPFITHIAQFLQNYRFKQLIQFIEQYMNNNV
ncbi:PAS domain S-box protein [candidate division CSSED10-310 bacterium]|uniref:histidine kinase n=1 Tax=candidate division CSSED10-310 bacterium TaxID=2855610 RepID=A0ABV6YXX9_UNCC1